jgi:hypothetical protein
VQGALSWIVIHALHAVFFEPVDVNQQLSNVVGTLAVQAGHHIGNMRQLLWVKGADANLIAGAVGLRRFDIQVRAY